MIKAARRILSASTVLIAIIHLGVAQANWPNDPNLNVPICTAANNQSYPEIVSDGAGGAIITWTDLRGVDYNVYAQRVNAAGVPQWTADGVAICPLATWQQYPKIASDGAGGAIITWEDRRSGGNEIYAQRVNAAGISQWTANGVVLCTGPGSQMDPVIVSDGAGGAFVTWWGLRSSGTDFNVYAQRVDAAGVPQWIANGVTLCSAPAEQYRPTILADGAGGAFVTWTDRRSGTDDVYSQRVDGAGVAQWTADGVPLCTAAYQQICGPMAVSDGAGGFIVMWLDRRNSLGGSFDVYAQRVNPAGVSQWTADGVAVCVAPNNQWLTTITSDGAGGAIFTWYDDRSGLFSDIYAQRVNAAGLTQWTADGVALCSAAGSQRYPTITTDGAGGAIVTWFDSRGGTYSDIYAQRVNGAGVPQWIANGVAISTAANNQQYPTIDSDGAGGAIVTWFDNRNGPASDIYAQNINADGTLGGDVPVPVLVSLISADAYADHVSLQWYTHDLSSAVISRTTPGGAWVEIARVAPNGMGKISYTDNSVSPGVRYGYRLTSATALDGASYAETWVDTPQTSEFALNGLRPNPTVRGLTVSFSLAGLDPAHLDVLDVGGRSVLSREVGSLGPGNHTVDVAEGRVMPPGVYLVRLFQGSRSLTARGVVIR